MGWKVLFRTALLATVIASVTPCLDCDCLQTQQVIKVPKTTLPLKTTIAAGCPSLLGYLKWLRQERAKFFKNIDKYEDTVVIKQDPIKIKTDNLITKLKEKRTEDAKTICSCPLAFEKPLGCKCFKPCVQTLIKRLPSVGKPMVAYLVDPTDASKLVEKDPENEDEEVDYCATCAILKKLCDKCKAETMRGVDEDDNCTVCKAMKNVCAKCKLLPKDNIDEEKDDDNIETVEDVDEDEEDIDNNNYSQSEEDEYNEDVDDSDYEDDDDDDSDSSGDGEIPSDKMCKKCKKYNKCDCDKNDIMIKIIRSGSTKNIKM